MYEQVKINLNIVKKVVKYVAIPCTTGVVVVLRFHITALFVLKLQSCVNGGNEKISFNFPVFAKNV